MSGTWQRTGTIATGGSVLSICTGAGGRTWLATGGGILRNADGGWQPLPDPSPMEQAGLVGSAGADWWVAGLSGGLILTWDGGRSWASAWIDQVSEPITCLAASPAYGRDITVLTGTTGSGVLRSTDGGRRWQLSNFGLEEFTILALATAGDWSRRQVVFAGTADGVYRSSGGGRAWKSVGLKGLTVQSLASAPRPAGASGEGGMPDASGPWTILAGTEADGLHRSVDGGFTWQPCGREIGVEAGINALLCPGKVWLAGVDDGTLWRSADNGDTWSLVCVPEGPVLVLAEGAGRLLAGTAEQGLWTSTDLGLTWHRDDTLCAWGFRRLYRTAGQELAALSPTGGVWLSTDAGRSWKRALDAALYEPVLAYAAVGNFGLAARADGLYRTSDGATWQRALGSAPALVLETGDAPIVALASPGGPDTIWAGAADGGLWSSDDAGASWRPLEAPFRGQQLLGLAFSPDDGTPLAGTFAGQGREAVLWRRADGRWQRWLSRSDTWPGLALAAAGVLAEGSWAALGGKPYAHTATGWREIQTPGHEGGVAVITSVTAAGSRYLICDSEVLCCDEDCRWRLIPLPEGSPAPVDLCLLPTGELLCLDAIAGVWRLRP